MSLNRRGFLRGGVAGTAGAALGAGLLAGGAHADAQAGETGAVPSRYPFHGAHQSGVLTPAPAAKQNFACLAAFDSMAGSRAELVALMRTLTGRARFLTEGEPRPMLASAPRRRTATSSDRSSRPTASRSPSRSAPACSTAGTASARASPRT